MSSIIIGTLVISAVSILITLAGIMAIIMLPSEISLTGLLLVSLAVAVWPRR